MKWESDMFDITSYIANEWIRPSSHKRYPAICIYHTLYSSDGNKNTAHPRSIWSNPTEYDGITTSNTQPGIIRNSGYNYDLVMMMIRWVINILLSSRSPTLDRVSWIHTLCIENTTKVVERINYILNTLSTENTQHKFTDWSRFLTACVQPLWAVLYDDDNERHNTP